MSPGSRFQNIVSGVLATCALVVVALMVKREFGIAAPVQGGVQVTKVGGWDTLLTPGHRMGSATPALTVLEFSDFECPACRAFENGTLGPFLKDNVGSVAVVFRHWALEYHRFALPTARAGECAAKLGQFPEFYRLVYEKQDSLGLKSLESFAAEIGIADTARFKACRESTAFDSLVARDGAVAMAIGGGGTPTVLVNGWLFKHPPSRTQLDSALAEAKRGSQ